MRYPPLSQAVPPSFFGGRIYLRVVTGSADRLNKHDMAVCAFALSRCRCVPNLETIGLAIKLRSDAYIVSIEIDLPFCHAPGSQAVCIDIDGRSIPNQDEKISSTVFFNRIPIQPPAQFRTVVSVARSDTCGERAHTASCAPLLPRTGRGLRSQVVAHDSGIVDGAGGAVKSETVSARKRL